VSKYTGDDRVLRAKSYPLTNLIEFRQRKACCPWHSEKTPSLHYYPKTNTAYCFGACGKAYDSIDAYRLKNGVGFVDAVKALNDMV
jgi:DNA primase